MVGVGVVTLTDVGFICMSDRYVAIDVETGCGLGCTKKCDHALNFKTSSLLGMGWWVSATEHGWFDEPVALGQWLAAENARGTRFIGHNIRFDQKVLMHHTGVWVEPGFDTRLAASLLPDRPPNLRLEMVAAKYLNIPPWKDEDMLRNMGAVSPETTRAYCLTDCENTYLLARELFCRLGNVGLLSFYQTFLIPVAAVLAQVEYRGIAIDRPKLQSFWKSGLESEQVLHNGLQEKYKDLINEYEETKVKEKLAKLKKPKATSEALAREANRFNFNSEAQVKWLLTEKLGIPCRKWDGSISTDKDTLFLYKATHPIISDLLELRRTTHQITYYKNWWEASARDGRIRSNYNLDVTRTGRLSSSEPNLQNIDRGPARQVFTATPGKKLMVIDYAQIEPRIAAHYSGDPALLTAFTNEQDFYSVIIKGILGLSQSPDEIKANMPDIRRLGKIVGLAVLYGIGPNKLSDMLSRGSGRTVSYADAKSYINRFFDSFPGLRALRAKVGDELLSTGAVTNLLGRKVYIKPDEVYHKGVNALIQSSASDLCCASQLALLKAIAEAQLDAKLVLLVHDEVVYEVADTDVAALEQLVQIHMVDAWKTKLNVALKVEAAVGDNWGCKS